MNLGIGRFSGWLLRAVRSEGPHERFPPFPPSLPPPIFHCTSGFPQHTTRPNEFCGENGQARRDHHKGRAGRKNQHYADTHHAHSDHKDNHTFGGFQEHG